MARARWVPASQCRWMLLTSGSKASASSATVSGRRRCSSACGVTDWGNSIRDSAQKHKTSRKPYAFGSDPSLHHCEPYDAAGIGREGNRASHLLTLRRAICEQFPPGRGAAGVARMGSGLAAAHHAAAPAARQRKLRWRSFRRAAWRSLRWSVTNSIGLEGPKKPDQLAVGAVSQDGKFISRKRGS